MEAALEPEKRKPQLVIEDWTEYYRIITEQGLDLIFFPVVGSLPEYRKPAADLQEKWKRRLFSSAVMQLFKLQSMNKILEAFKQAGVPVVVVKGAAIARFYAHPEYREMGDLDILVQSRHWTDAQKVICSLGYTAVNDTHPTQNSYYKKGELPVEIHNGLTSPGFKELEELSNWYGHIWQNSCTASINNVEFRVMAVEDEIINQILHFSRHFIRGVCDKTRHFFDISLMIHRCGDKLDWNYIGRMLDELKLIRFGRLVFSVCGRCFHVNIPENMIDADGISPEEIFNIFLSSHAEQSISFNQYYKRMIYSSVCALSKYLVMLPLALIFDFLMHLKKSRGKFRHAFCISNHNKKVFLRRYRMLKQVGLLI